jgi:AT-binding transcription factor 1
MMSPENSRVESSEADKMMVDSNANDDDAKMDVAKFDGKIVYNPDGSAYIIEDCDDEDSLPLPKQEGSIVELPGATVVKTFFFVADEGAK